MATYTHTFDIRLDGAAIEGEINFNHGEDARIKTTNSGNIEMTLEQNGKIQYLFEVLRQLAQCCDEIEKIEITKK